MKKAIKAIDKLIKIAKRRFEQAKERDDYAHMAILDGYLSGLEEGKVIIVISFADTEKEGR